MQQVLNQSLSNTPRTATATAPVQPTALREPQSPVAQISQQSSQPQNNSNLSDEQLAACIEQMHALG